MRPAIWGVGTTSFGKQPGRSAGALVREAVHEAFADADVTEVDAVYAGTVFGAPGSTQRALQTTGVIDVPIVTVENACASGTTAFHEAAQAVSTGRYERVLALGFETMTTQFATAIVPEETDREGRTGLAMPGIYAMAASRYVAEFGVTPAQLAAVAVKNRRHGAANPRAQHGSVVTAQEVLASRMIADPLTLLQCCSISDAAAAAVIGPPGTIGRSCCAAVPCVPADSGTTAAPVCGGGTSSTGPPSWPTRLPGSGPRTQTCSKCMTRSPSGRSSRWKPWG